MRHIPALGRALGKVEQPCNLSARHGACQVTLLRTQPVNQIPGAEHTRRSSNLDADKPCESGGRRVNHAWSVCAAVTLDWTLYSAALNRRKVQGLMHDFRL